MNKLICGDCLKAMELMILNGERFDCVIADPPDNIGMNYDAYRDRMPHNEYMDMIGCFMRRATRLSSIVWISYNAKWQWDMGCLVRNFLNRNSDWNAKPLVQTFTFGQNNTCDFGNGHRPIVRLSHKDAKFYPDAVKVPSWRQLNGDKRAAEGGRVPLDTWRGDGFTPETKPIPNIGLKELDDILKRVDISGEGCWNWQGAKSGEGGYGRVRIGDKTYGVHRVVWRMVHGSDPVGECVLHSCDNPACCNPDHLFLGSYSDNNKDKERKGRANHPRGSKNGLSKLSEQDVLEIYHSEETNVALAKKYGVNDRSISSIKMGKTWRHVTQQDTDVWEVPRVTGNSKQRRKWHPTQLNEDLVRRMVDFGTMPGDSILDCFSGTGTVLRVAEGRDVTSIEIDPAYCDQIVAEHDNLILQVGP